MLIQSDNVIKKYKNQLALGLLFRRNERRRSVGAIRT